MKPRLDRVKWGFVDQANRIVGAAKALRKPANDCEPTVTATENEDLLPFHGTASPKQKGRDLEIRPFSLHGKCPESKQKGELPAAR
jgi:hypothetical protein